MADLPPEGAPAPAPAPGRKLRYKAPHGTWNGKKRPHRKGVGAAAAAAAPNPTTPTEGAAPGESKPPAKAPAPDVTQPAGPAPAVAAAPREPEKKPEPTAEEARQIAAGVARLKSERGLKACTKVYAFPFQVWQNRVRKKGCPLEIVPPERELQEGGDALREIILMFPGTWLRYAPFLELGFTAAKHYLQAADKLDVWEAAVKWERERAKSALGARPGDATGGPPPRTAAFVPVVPPPPPTSVETGAPPAEAPPPMTAGGAPGAAAA